MASKAPCCIQLSGVAGIWWRAQCNAIVLPVPGFVNYVLIFSFLAAG